MSNPGSAALPRHRALAIWGLGAVVGVGSTVWSLSHQVPHHYEATLEMFLSMAAILFINEVLPDHGSIDWITGWPLLGLTATAIVFWRDPLIAVLTILMAAPLAGLVKGQSIMGQVTKTAWWLIAFGLGLLLLVATSYVGGGASLLGTGFLIVGFGLTGNYVRIAVLKPAATSQRGFFNSLETILEPFVASAGGAIYGLSWHTPQLGSLDLDGGQLALVAGIGIVIGYLLGGRVARLWLGLDAIPAAIPLAVLILGIGVLVLPRRVELALVTLAVSTVLVVAVRARVIGGILVCLGGLANLIVDELNGGMPIDPSAFFSLVGPSGYARYASHTYLESASTKLPLLDDRILMPHPLPFAEVLSVGDLILVIGLAVLIVERMLGGRGAAREKPQHESLSAA